MKNNFPKFWIRNLTLSATSLCSVLLLSTAGQALAQSGTWSSTSNGLWSSSGNWAGGVVASGASNTANFNTVDLPGDLTVSLDSPFTIGTLIFGDTGTSTAAGWTLDNNGSTANILTLAGGSTPTITVNALGSGKVATISAQLAGTTGFIKNGAGTLVLTSSNNYTGNTQITAGTLRAADSTVYAGATGTSSVLGNNSQINFANNTTLDLRANGSNDSSTQTITFKNTIQIGSTNTSFTVNVDRASVTGGTGKVLSLGATTIANGGTLNITGADSYSLGLSSLNVGSGGGAGSVTLNPTTASVILGNITNQGTTFAHTVILGGTSTGNVISGTIANSGASGILSVSKTNSSTWMLTGSSTYTGSTSVAAGTLIVSGNGSLNGTSGISITGGTFTYGSNTAALTRDVALNGGTFRQNSSLNYSGNLTFTSGTVAGTNFSGVGLSIGANQTIAPGNSTGTLTSGAQTWASQGTYAWDINNATGAAGSGSSGWDLLSIAGGLTLTATSSSKFTINVLSLTGLQTPGDAQNFNAATSYSWLIADASSAISTFDTSAFNVNTGGFTNSFDGTWSIVRGDSVSGGDNTQIYLAYTAVPEPSTWALVLVAGILWGVAQRRTPSNSKLA